MARLDSFPSSFFVAKNTSGSGAAPRGQPQTRGAFTLRHATSTDHTALGMVCLKTGNAGQDASPTEDDRSLLGLIYAIPYQVAEPDFAFVLADRVGVCGYVLGAADTVRFQQFMADDWFPPLRKKLRNPGANDARWRGSDWARWQIHQTPTLPQVDLALYPAHGHIDLLPRAQGQGLGRWAMETLMDALKSAGCPGLHLGLSPQNTTALAFYHRLGFHTLQVQDDSDDTLYVGKAL